VARASRRESDADGGPTFETAAEVVHEIQRRLAAD